MKRNVIISIAIFFILTLSFYSCQGESNNTFINGAIESRTGEKSKNETSANETAPSSNTTGQAVNENVVTPGADKQTTRQTETAAESSQTAAKPSKAGQQTEQKSASEQAVQEVSPQQETTPQYVPEQNVNIEAADPDKKRQEIVSRYASLFQSLKNESISRLNSLLGQAKSELNSVPGDKKISAKVSLGFKYMQLGKSLEGEIDSRFYSLLDGMENELKSNNLPTDAVADAKYQYNSEKSERRSYILSKVFK